MKYQLLTTLENLKKNFAELDNNVVNSSKLFEMEYEDECGNKKYCNGKFLIWQALLNWIMLTLTRVLNG